MNTKKQNIRREEIGLWDIDLEARILHALCTQETLLADGMALLQKDYFASPTSQRVFEVIQYLYQNNKPVSLVTVYEEAKDLLNKNNEWALIESTFASKLDMQFCSEKLKKLLQARELNSLAEEVQEQIKAKEEISAVIEKTQNKLFTLTTKEQVENILSPKELSVKILDVVADAMDKKSSGGIMTRYKDLNYITNGGFQHGELIIIGAKTGKGKTAFAMNMMHDIAVVQKIPSLYINTEMNDKQMANRWVSILTKDQNITYRKVATGELTDQEFQHIVESLDRLNNSGFYSITVPDLNIDNLVSIARRFKVQTELRVLVVDYVGRMDTTDNKLQEWQVMKTIAKRLKTLAQQLEITVIMLAQINEGEQLEGSKGMKNECDLFGYLREMSEEEKFQFNDKNYCLVVQKNRNGPCGKVPLKFIGEKMLFVGG